MLVLTRKAGEGVVIGDDIKITVIEIKGGGVRIGIAAPASVKVHRSEIYEKILQENQEASKWDLADLNQLSADLQARKEETK